MQLAHLMIDAAAAESGAWRPAVGLPGVEFRLRGTDNLDWRRLNAKLMAALPREKQLAPSLDPADEDAITAELLARTVLLDWRGFVRADGSPEPYDAERAFAMLADPAFRRFRNSVLSTARILANETLAEREAAAKNSATGSPGT